MAQRRQGAVARPIITLLTDFGNADPYVGVMKGVIAGICPEANVIDITHEVAQGDVQSGAFFLERSLRYFPTGPVHVAIIDPGVGTARVPLAVASGGHLFVGPDNGVLSLAAPRGRAVALTRRGFFLPHISNTFHGRDVFAPVAAHLASGVSIEKLGPARRRFMKLAARRPRKVKGGLLARIVSVDRFGNLITNIEPHDWNALRRPRVVIGDFVSGEVRSTYAAARPGELLLVFGGYGRLEIAVRNGSAAETLELAAGDGVRIATATSIR
jgi:S-adenosyl-L-methionine hydrolase (adenosine-forming)